LYTVHDISESPRLFGYLGSQEDACAENPAAFLVVVVVIIIIFFSFSTLNLILGL
jgi:hypothetical protein